MLCDANNVCDTAYAFRGRGDRVIEVGDGVSESQARGGGGGRREDRRRRMETMAREKEVSNKSV